MDTAARLHRIAVAAADEVGDGMLLGLGTGATAGAVIRELGSRVGRGLRIAGVPTSRGTAALAGAVGIPLRSLDEVDRIDLGIDGADEIDPELNLIKGGGAALLVEKLVALACDDYLVVAAAEKRSPALGTRFRLPVEVVPIGWGHTAERLRRLGFGLEPELRVSGGDPVCTDTGHLLLDCATAPIADPAALGAAVKAVTGVVDHGLFVGLTRRVLLVEADGTLVGLSPR
ncbi:MAG: ribose-5-phosphate isomerase RpiA [Chloroflexia bacterium]|nr:ribose-5-phosphate isomerase RpiA [Chloroflexia bacterium]